MLICNIGLALGCLFTVTGVSSPIGQWLELSHVFGRYDHLMNKAREREQDAME
jgi:hypothetical protein